MAKYRSSRGYELCKGTPGSRTRTLKPRENVMLHVCYKDGKAYHGTPIHLQDLGQLEIFDLLKTAGAALSEVQYEALPGMDTGCWKINCERSPFYIPFQTQTVHYNFQGIDLVARKEINLLPWIAGAALLFYLMK